MEIKVIKQNGDREVVTSYPRSMEAGVIALLASYIAQGIKFTVTYE